MKQRAVFSENWITPRASAIPNNLRSRKSCLPITLLNDLSKEDGYNLPLRALSAYCLKTCERYPAC